MWIVWQKCGSTHTPLERGPRKEEEAWKTNEALLVGIVSLCCLSSRELKQLVGHLRMHVS